MKILTKKQKALQDDWDALLRKHARPLERGAKSFGVRPVRLPKAEIHLPTPKSKFDIATMTGSTALPEQKVYTGTKIIGISTMHKSNLVPVFSQEEAQDIATMRRG